MAFQLYTLPSGKILKLQPPEARMLDAIMDDPDHVRGDLEQVHRPKGMSSRTLYTLAGTGALVRVNHACDTYLYARCFWGNHCPHLVGHGNDATRSDLLAPSRGVQAATGAAMAAGWVDTVHDTDNRIITFERPGQTIDIRFSVPGTMLELTVDDRNVFPATMPSLVSALRARKPVRVAVPRSGSSVFFTGWSS